jgi:hypothetical protein
MQPLHIRPGRYVDKLLAGSWSGSEQAIKGTEPIQSFLLVSDSSPDTPQRGISAKRESTVSVKWLKSFPSFLFLPSALWEKSVDLL